VKALHATKADKRISASGLVRRNLSLDIADQIEEYILSSKLTTGSKLPGERFLSRSFGISRTVLREALQILETKGIVETSAARGVFVTNASFQKTTSALSEHLVRAAIPLREFIDARRLLEIHIATLAAKNRTEADLAALQKNFERMASAIDDPDLFFKEDVDFHTQMARASGNQLYPVWLQPIMENLMLLSSHKQLLRVRERIIVCHRAILLAVEAADSEAARDAVARHIDQYEEDAYAFST
jgi:GntR family transcriptional repressor for pyruvate dehydrogenase complex